MSQVPILPGMESLAPRYDGFILDLWGVIHDGQTAYPGAPDCMRRLKQAGKRVVLLSNAPRRAAVIAEQMAPMGITPDLFDAILSSGEAVFQALRDRRDPWFRALGRRCWFLGPERDHCLIDGLDIEMVALEDAEFIINAGPWDIDARVADFEPALKIARARRLPMICANPDLEVMRDGKRAICAGAVAARYAEMGGDVAYRGKPHPEIYADCLPLMGGVAQTRILAVGDSFRTDIAGASIAGLDSALVAGGIHGEELGLPIVASHLQALCASWNLWPKAAMAAFVW